MKRGWKPTCSHPIRITHNWFVTMFSCSVLVMAVDMICLQDIFDDRHREFDVFRCLLFPYLLPKFFSFTFFSRYSRVRSFSFLALIFSDILCHTFVVFEKRKVISYTAPMR